MLANNNFITSSCVISNQRVFKNDTQLFEKKQGSAAEFLVAIYQQLGAKYPKFYKMDNLSRLGWLASEILLEGIQLGKYAPYETGVVLSNSSSSLDTDLRYFETTKDIASPSLFVYTLPNIVIGEICIRNHFCGENAFFVAAGFDANFTKQYVNNLINNNILQTCICGWVELLGENYKAALFLVEKTGTETSIPFTTENICKIYQR